MPRTLLLGTAAGYLKGVSPDDFYSMFGASNLMICAFVSPPSLFLFSLAKHIMESLFQI